MANGHPTRDEDFDLLALGALEGNERQALEMHVESCADCARKLSAARGRVAMLSLAAPRVEPPAAVKQRLMAQVRATAAPAGATGAASTARDRPAPPSPFSRWWNAVLIPVGVALALVTLLLWHENRALDRQLETLRASVNQQQQELNEAREVAELMTSQATITIPLAQQAGMPKGSAHVMYNAKMDMIMYDGEIMPAPSAKTYQLWLVPVKGNPISCGTFSGQPDHWMMKLPEGMSPKEFAVTLEPAGGMPHPTGPMVLMGSVS
ncbi:MAG TPA: anti-sigma factor [Candidatus Acidoferrales bacterium]|jgi:anti-sigma-K factor RskA|nr:anti-sigma factor [Candidatus Acidoferrales bacterium]